MPTGNFKPVLRSADTPLSGLPSRLPLRWHSKAEDENWVLVGGVLGVEANAGARYRGGAFVERGVRATIRRVMMEH